MDVVGLIHLFIRPLPGAITVLGNRTVTIECHLVGESVDSLKTRKT